MLVLSRKQNERIRVGESVVVTVVRVSGDKVRKLNHKLDVRPPGLRRRSPGGPLRGRPIHGCWGLDCLFFLVPARIVA